MAFSPLPNHVSRRRKRSEQDAILAKGTYPVMMIKTLDSGADGEMACCSMATTVTGQKSDLLIYPRDTIMQTGEWKENNTDPV